ncbi:MAG: hypothetical protein LBF17_02490 [Mediterranea sp.]|jgi:hypothetical protein|nr:hypothetical protein [Mediterranea sp.]
MKKYIDNVLWILVLFSMLTGLFTSCNEDLGNYDYTEINTVAIGEEYDANGELKEGINDRTCDAGSTLKIEPILIFSSGEDESLFAYTWYYWKSDKWQVLQEGRDLEIEIADPIGTPDRSYSLAYELVNKKTQIPYRKLFSVRVTNVLSRGFIALCEQENGFDIDQIALSGSGELKLYKNVLEMSGSELPRQGVKPYDIVAFQDPMAPDPYNRVGLPYSLYILTDQYTTRVLTTDYSWKPSYDISNSVESNSYLDKEYKQKGKPIVCQQMKYTYSVVSDKFNVKTLIYVKEADGRGNWYVCNRWPAWYFYSVPMNDVRPGGGSRYEPSPSAFCGFNSAMYFDIDKKAFMYQSFPRSAANMNTTDLYYTEALPQEASGAAFNFSDPNEGLLYMGEQQDAIYPSAAYAILKQADDSFKYIEFGDGSSLNNVVVTSNKKRVSIIPANSNIGNAKFFARAPYSNVPYLYYVTNDNKVYKVDISAANAIVSDITSTILTNDGYSEITTFKYLLPNTNGSGADRTLAVATYNPSLGKDTGGKLEFFLIEDQASGQLVRAKFPSGEVEEGAYQIDMSWKGLGKVVGLSYKEYKEV